MYKYEHSPLAQEQRGIKSPDTVCLDETVFPLTGCLRKRSLKEAPFDQWLLPTHRSYRKEKALLGARLPVSTEQDPSSNVRQDEWHHGTNLFTFVTALQIAFVTWVLFSDQCTSPLVRSLLNPLWQSLNLAILTSKIQTLSSQPYQYHLVAASFLILLCLSFLRKMGLPVISTV